MVAEDRGLSGSKSDMQENGAAAIGRTSVAGDC